MAKILKFVQQFSKEKRLGIAEEARRYDLPFSRDEGTDFLIILVGLMTFLAVMALTASMILSGMAERWSSGLENGLTIEISSETPDKELRNPEDIRKIEKEIAEKLRDDPAVESFDILDSNDVNALLEPWLGKTPTQEIPLPGLISVKISSDNPEDLNNLRKQIEPLAPGITVDTHEDWLQDLLNLVRTLKLSAAIVTLIIGLTTLAAIAGAVKSRIAIYKADVELLHLMGANDEYITRQFQRYTLMLALKGAAAGTLTALLAVFIFGHISATQENSITPNLSLGLSNIAFLLLVPLIASVLAGLTARLTVLRALSQMP